MENELSRVVDALPGFVWTARPDGQVDFLSQPWCEYTGLGLAQSCGRGWQCAVHPDDLPQLLAGWQPVAPSKAPVGGQARLRGQDGRYRWYSFRARASADASGQVAAWCGLATDIDGEVAAEQARHSADGASGIGKDNSLLILDNIPGIVLFMKPDGELEFANSTVTTYFGKSLAELKRWAEDDTIHPEDRPHVVDVFKQAIASGHPYKFEGRFRSRNGTYRWFKCRGIPSRDPAGRIVRWRAVGIDIEDQKRAEALLAGEKRLLEMVANDWALSEVLEALCRHVESTASGSYCSIVLVDPGGTKLQEAIAPSLPAEFNEAVRGWSLERLGGPCQVAARDKTQTIMSDVASDARWRTSWRSLAQKHGLRSCWSTPIVSRAGKVLGTFALYQREAGTPNQRQLELIEQFRNIASIAIERAQRDDALRQSEARRTEVERDLQQMIDTIPVFVAAYEPDGTRSFVNRTWQDYMGLTLEEATDPNTKKTFPHFHPADAERIDGAWRASLASGQPLLTEARVRRADGQYRWHTSHRVPLRDEQGRIIRWYSVGIDIEEKKRAEEALRGSEAQLAKAEHELQLTIDTIPTLVATYRPDGSRIFVNQTWRDYLGLQPDDAVDAFRTAVVHPEDATRVLEEWQRCLTAGLPFSAEMRLRRADGVYRWHTVHRVLVRDESGAIIKWYSVGVDIEEQKRSEERLRQSEARLADAKQELQLTIDTIPTLIASYWPNGERDFVSKNWQEYTGISQEQARGKSSVITFPPDRMDAGEDMWRACLASGEPYEADERLRRADGEYRWHWIHRVPLRDDSGKIIKWYGVGHDIEHQKQAEAALLDSEARLREAERELRLTLDSIPTITWRAGANGYVQQLNKRWFEYTGTTHDQVHGWRWKLCVHPDDLDQLVEIGSRYVASGEPIDSEARLRRHDGEYRWFLFRPAPVRDEAGNVVAWYGSITDIEDRKRAEQKALEAEREVQHMLDSIPAMIVRGGPNGYIQYFSKQWFDYTGTTLETQRGFRWWEFLHPDDKDRLVEFGARFVATGVTADCEARLRCSDGTYRWFLFRPAASRDDAGNFIGWYGTVTDIEDQRRAEEELRRSETFLAEGQRISSTGTFSWRVDTDELKFSEELCRIFELDPSVTVTFEQVFARIHPEDRLTLSERMKLIREGRGSVEQELRLMMPGGLIKHLRSVGQMVQHQDGRPEYLGAIQDITARRCAEEALDKVRSELTHVTRVMSLGALTASIAHEVNQPLAGIITNASTCLRMLAADPPNVDGARETARRTIRDGNRAADVIARLRALFGKKAAVTETLDLNDATREVVTLVFGDLLRNRIMVRVELGEEPLPVTGDRTQLQQVILNLVRNASDAMAEVSDRPRQLVISAEREPDGGARLTVRDTGVGLQAQTAERLFDAFFTTKGDGMGIGLSVSRSIIESHGGKLWAQANDGPGATFSFSIPRGSVDAGEGAADAIWTRPTTGALDQTRNA